MLSDLIMKIVIRSTIHWQYFHRGKNPLLTEEKDEFMIIEDDIYYLNQIKKEEDMEGYSRKDIQPLQLHDETPITISISAKKKKK